MDNCDTYVESLAKTKERVRETPKPRVDEDYEDEWVCSGALNFSSPMEMPMCNGDCGEGAQHYIYECPKKAHRNTTMTIPIEDLLQATDSKNSDEQSKGSVEDSIYPVNLFPRRKSKK
jgi:hypothetical protein